MQLKKQRVSKSLYYFVPTKYESDVEYAITFRALSYKELIFTQQFADANQYNQLAYQVCKIAIISIEDNLGNECDISLLSIDSLKEISEQIISVSVTTEEEIEKLQFGMELTLDSKFKSDTWKCEQCRAKKLDKVRNCGYLGEKDKIPDFSVMVGSQIFTYCPIYDLEVDIVNDAMDCYTMYDKNTLPDSGGLYDQTNFFVISSNIVASRIMEEEQKEIKKLKERNGKNNRV